MIEVDRSKCTGCGRCMVMCPREAIRVWGWCEVDTTRCRDCFGGLHDFGENLPLDDRQATLDPVKTLWIRSCLENCPNDALSEKEE